MRKTLLFFMAVFVLSSCATKQNPQEEKVKASYATYNSLDASINNAIAQVQQEHKNNEIVREEELEPLFEKSQKLYRAVKFYKNNQPTGTWQWFDESNNLSRKLTMKMGNCTAGGEPMMIKLVGLYGKYHTNMESNMA